MSDLKRTLAQPLVRSAWATTRAAWQWLAKRYPPQYQIDTAPMFEGFTQYEPLFLTTEANFESILTPFVQECAWPVGHEYNGQFVSVDAELYYCMVRTHDPQLIIEIGSGYSTHFAADAVKRNRTGRMISVDPDPRRSLPRQVVHMQTRVEDVDAQIFADLRENDILFIDSSHTTEEA